MADLRHPVDVNAFIGAYPFRYVPHPEPDVLVRVLGREGIDAAWVASLSTAFHRDPSHGNASLFAALAPFGPTLLPVPTVRAGWPGWRHTIDAAAAHGAPAVRAYPNLTGSSTADVVSLAGACAAAGLVLLLNVKFEDVRQRHPLDAAGDLAAAVVRAAVRDSDARVILTAAGREMIDELHWSLAPAEQERLWYDLSWVWGPPEEHLAKLLRSLGAGRFVFGTAWPLRLTQTPRAALALLGADLANPALADPRAIAAAARGASAR